MQLYFTHIDFEMNEFVGIYTTNGARFAAGKLAF